MRDLRAHLKNSGQRMTAQRAAVYDALCASASHPTAEELFLSIREQISGISLATVYNTLEMLVENGLAIKISGDRSARYDAVCVPHAHTRCIRCGKLTNLPPYTLDEVLKILPLPDDFTPQTASIEVEGTCVRCGVTVPDTRAE